MGIKKDLKGQVFGKLTVESFSHIDESFSKPRRMWNTICECGNKKQVWTSNLTRGKTKSCGCLLNKPDLIGQTFGYGKVIDKASYRRESNRQEWILKCKCGNIYQATTSQLTGKVGNRTRSCGCYAKIRGPERWNYGGKISKNKRGPYKKLPINVNIWTRIKRSAKKKNLELNITPKYIVDLFESQNRKCVYTGWDINCLVEHYVDDYHTITASLDRIDSNKGYIKGNVQWVHKHINAMKNSHTEEYFLEICKAIAKNHS